MDYAIVLVTPPSAEPLTSAEAGAHARLGTLQAEEVALLDGYIMAARQRCEDVSWRQMLTATYRLRLPRFPSVCDPNEGVVRDGGILLPRPPLQTLTSITYVDQDGVTQTLATSAYQVEPPAGQGSERALILPAYGESWPSTRPVPGAVQVNYTAGYGDAGSAVPQTLLQGIRCMVARMYQLREDAEAAARASGADQVFFAARAW